MISIFKNFKEVMEHKDIIEIKEEIPKEKYIQAIVNLLKSLLKNKVEVCEKAKRLLPVFKPCGKFVGGRKMEFFSAYSIQLFWT